MDAIYPVALDALFISAPVIFIALFFVTAPYGRYGSEKRGIPARYAWFIMEFPATAVPILLFFLGGRRTGMTGLFLLLWEIHYLYRTVIYSLLMRGGSAKRFPLYLALSAFVFNCTNGFANGYHLFAGSATYSTRWLIDPRFLLGVALFAFGWYTHVSTDRRLRALRAGNDCGYSIPRGGMFRYISAPNYFGEIVQWFGWAIATWSLPGLAFALFTFANLVPRAISHHRWYRDNFEGYPEERKAIIPFLW